MLHFSHSTIWWERPTNLNPGLVIVVVHATYKYSECERQKYPKFHTSTILLGTANLVQKAP